ncbi:hypothetical protein FQZ97_900150 [compost metagenome]
MGHHHLDAVQFVQLAQQVVAHQQTHFAHHVHWRAQEQIERSGDHALGRVFHADHAVLRGAGRRGVEHLVEVGAVDQVGGTAKELDGGLLTESALRAQHGHALRSLQRQTGRHYLAPDRGHMLVQQGALVGRLDLFDHLGNAIRAEEG